MKTAYYNGIIYPNMDSNFVNTMIVENDKILEIGNNLNISNEMNKVDLKKRVVLAGLIDTHIHIISSAKLMREINCSNATSINSLVELVKNKMNDGNSWIVGRGWNHDYFNDLSLPTKDDLDKISLTRPICLVRACGHIAVVNTCALDILNISKNNIPKIDGGLIYTDENGNPNGLFSEFALDLIYNNFKVPSKNLLKELIIEAANSLLSYGITSVHSDDFKSFYNIPYEMIIDTYNELVQENKLPIRVYQQCLLPEPNLLEQFLQKGYKTNIGNDYYRFGPLKLLIDGSLGARTAWLSRPYSDDPTTSGVATYDISTFKEMVRKAHENKMQIAVHTIGDQAIQCALDTFSELQDSNNLNRHGLVHVQITTLNQLELMAKNNILAYVQPIFLHYDQHIVEQRVGLELASTSYHFKTMNDLGIKSSYGTDSPVESFNPWENIYCAITRKDLNGNGPWHINQQVSLKQAIDTYTRGGAFASFDENKKGQLLPGMLADFIVLENDIFKMDIDKIKEATVYMSVVGGEIKYQK